MYVYTKHSKHTLELVSLWCRRVGGRAFRFFDSYIRDNTPLSLFCFWRVGRPKADRNVPTGCHLHECADFCWSSRECDLFSRCTLRGANFLAVVHAYIFLKVHVLFACVTEKKDVHGHPSNTKSYLLEKRRLLRALRRLGCAFRQH